jgi:endonuclease/exonuclease/phosphatase (EEP) superfamily protein YafD
MESPAPLRVATYNINFANVNLDAVLNAIRQADADVVCLQETNNASAAALRAAFSDHYPEIRFYGSVDPYPAGGLAILSKHPIAREEFLPARHGLFGAAIVEVTHGEQNVQIVWVHLQPIVLPRGQGAESMLAIVGAFDAAEETRRAEMEEILKHVRTDGPAILAGDFNSCSTFQAPALAKQHGLIDSFAAVHDDADDHPTWHWPTELGQAKLRIDYIFHSADFVAEESRVIPSEGSDHYLLVSQLNPK